MWSFFNVQRIISPKECNPELRFLRCARFSSSLTFVFHDNFSNDFRVTERTRFCDRQTTDSTGINIMFPLRGET